MERGGKPKTRQPTPSLFLLRASSVLAKPPNSQSKGSNLQPIRAHFEHFAGVTRDPHPIRDPITACMRADAHARGQQDSQLACAFVIHQPPHRNFIPMLKLHAGVSKKVGLPGFSSASASCTIEAELDSSLLQDHEGFQVVVQRAYQSCEKAVEDQIARLTSEPNDASQPQEVIEVRTSPAISGARITTNGADVRATNGAELLATNRAAFRDAPSPRPATASQVKAIRAICARRRIDLVSLLRDRFGLTTADELGIRQASNLIDELKNDEPADGPAHTNGNGALSEAGGGR